MEEEGQILKEKIVKGVLALTTRNFLLNIFAFVSNFILTILLTPQIFGVFFLVSSVISFLNYFSDIGLAAALIQKKEEPTSEELSTVFFLQESLVVMLVGFFFFFSSYIIRFYNLEEAGRFLLFSLIFSFFLSSLKTIPSVLLERKIEFGLLAVPQVIENFVYYLVTIILAFLGLGLYSFAWGAMIRGIVGLLVIYLLSPWLPQFHLSFAAVKNLLAFGIPFQANSLLALLKDDLLTLFLGKILPLRELGYLGWAKKWAETPLRIIMDSVIRVTFPAYSRLQKNQELLRKALEKTIFFLALFIFPASFLMVILIRPIIFLIPSYTKWEPAVLSFYIFSFTSLMAAFSSPIVNALNALGKIQVTLKLMIFWTFATWILIPLSVSRYGFNGVAFALLIISFTSVIPIILLRHFVKFAVWSKISPPLFITFISFVPVFFLLSPLQHLAEITLYLLLSGIIFIFFSFLFLKEEIFSFFPRFRLFIFKR